MPHYDYGCDGCKEEFTVKQSIHEKSLEKCVLCDSSAVARIIRAPIIIDKTPRTLGTLGEQNAKKAGVYGRSDRLAAEQEGKPARPSYRKDMDKADLGINKFTPTEVTRYIQEGVRPIGK